MPRLSEPRIGREGHCLPHESLCSDIVRKNAYTAWKSDSLPEAVLGSDFLGKNDEPKSSRENQQFLYLGLQGKRVMSFYTSSIWMDPGFLGNPTGSVWGQGCNETLTSSLWLGKAHTP